MTREYSKREFCKAMECPLQRLIDLSIEWKNDLKDICKTKCLFTAWKFHDWLQEQNFKIIKEEE